MHTLLAFLVGAVRAAPTLACRLAVFAATHAPTTATSPWRLYHWVCVARLNHGYLARDLAGRVVADLRGAAACDAAVVTEAITTNALSAAQALDHGVLVGRVTQQVCRKVAMGVACCVASCSGDHARWRWKEALRTALTGNLAFIHLVCDLSSDQAEEELMAAIVCGSHCLFGGGVAPKDVAAASLSLPSRSGTRFWRLWRAECVAQCAHQETLTAALCQVLKALRPRDFVRVVSGRGVVT